ncbi:MAG: hypothetical protein DMG72_16350 [Acidobacteria bacterium]|nr:MAG: hypothetical protein DMG72_16350 [Acidobacteriota bacterium]
MYEISTKHEKQSPLRAPATLFWQKTRQQAARVPIKAWIVLGLFTVAAILMALYTASLAKTATLHLKVQHGFRSAQIYLWVDGDLAYSGKLTGSAKKKFGLIPDSVQGSLSQNVPLTSGKHLIRVQVASDDGSTVDDGISGEFVRNSERNLSVSARRGDLSLSWQVANSTVGESPDHVGWLGRYASTLFLTIAGSIISALTGYAIRELPKQIGSRQSEAPKI